MPILNYTTQIQAEKTVSEIQSLLAKAKASAVMSEFDESGIITHISFKITVPTGEVTFRLPANIDKVFLAMKKDAKIPLKLRTKEQAARVAWRIIKDWVSAQLAIIQAEMVTTAEVFLPYMQTGIDETLYQKIEKGGFLALTHNKD